VGHLTQTPCPSRVTWSRLHRTLSRQVFNISREGDSTTSLGNLFQGSITLRVKKFFLMFRWNFLCFSLCPLPQAQLPQPFLIGQMLQSPHHPCSPLLDSLQQLLIFLEVGSPELDRVLQMGPR